MARTGRPPTPRVDVICEGCGQSFSKRQSDVERSTTQRFFCSTECPGWSPKPRRRALRTCEQCGTAFYPRKDDARFCSNECRFAAMAVPGHDVICAGCGQEFHTRRDDAKFCSMECRFPGKRVKRAKCKQCHKKFDFYPSNKNVGKFCSKACFYTWQTENSLGHTDKDGYVTISVAGVSKKEHRHVMEQHLGRALESNETVHHVNGQRHDNKLGNLELWVSWQPKGQRVIDLIHWAEELLGKYSAEKPKLERV